MSDDRHDDSKDDGEEKIRERVRNARDPSLPGALACDVMAKRLKFLWRPYLPTAMLCDLQGDPGEGKSLICAYLAAVITGGRQFPDGTSAQMGNVLIVSAEDDEAVTLRPRLEAAGADLSLVRLWTITHGLPILPKDLEKLSRTIKEHQARLVVLDPLDAFFGDKVDPNSNPSVRRVLIDLARMAGRLGCTVLVVRHLNKDQKITNAIYRGAGSIGISAAARCVLLVGSTPDDSDAHVLAPVKMNLAKKPPALGYKIVEARIVGPDGKEIETQKIEWTGPVNFSARDLLGQPIETGGPRGPRPDKSEAAKALLSKALADGAWHPCKPIIDAAKELDISYSTLSDAAKVMNVLKTIKGFGKGRSHWSLPGTPNNSVTSTNLHGENDFTEGAENFKSSSENGGSREDLEFQDDNFVTSVNPCSPNHFDNSVAEDAEFRGPPTEDDEIDRLARADGWRPDEGRF